MQLLIKSVRSVFDVKNYSRNAKFSPWAVIWKCTFFPHLKNTRSKKHKAEWNLDKFKCRVLNCRTLIIYIFHYLHNLVLIEILIMLVAEPPNLKEAVTWLYQASIAGHVRSQYQLALCLHQGRGVNCSIKDAVCYSSLTHYILNLWVNCFLGRKCSEIGLTFPHLPILDCWLLVVH